MYGVGGWSTYVVNDALADEVHEGQGEEVKHAKELDREEEAGPLGYAHGEVGDIGVEHVVLLAKVTELQPTRGVGNGDVTRCWTKPTLALSYVCNTRTGRAH